MAGADGAAVPDGPEPVTEPDPGPDEEPGREEAPDMEKAPPPAAYGGVRVRAVGTAPSKRSGEVRPSP